MNQINNMVGLKIPVNMYMSTYRYTHMHTRIHIQLSGIYSLHYSVIHKLPRYWILLNTNKRVSPGSSAGDDETVEWLGSAVLCSLMLCWQNLPCCNGAWRDQEEAP